MNTKLSFEHTKKACYVGGITQAIVCGFMPLLFVIFNIDYGVALPLVTLLATVNFVMQFTMDFISLFFIDRVSYRATIVAAHILAGLGLLCIGLVVPNVENTYIALIFSVLLFSAGGGILEVLLSPIMEACPSDNKAAAMSFLHSMYGFGSVGVVVMTNILLLLFGKANWYWTAIIWSIIPFANAVYFMLVPINKIVEENKRMPMHKLFNRKSFLIFFLIMFCGGATEIAMSQWTSAFAESSLGISKALGDILGPCIFALMLAFSRVLYSKLAHKIDLATYLLCCGIATVFLYVFAAVLPFKFVAIVACGLCGFTAGIMWPGTLSLAAKTYPTGGAAMFGLLALAGDLGCTLGPTTVGMVSSAMGGNLRTGLLISSIFPVILIGAVVLLKKRVKKHPEMNI